VTGTVWESTKYEGGVYVAGKSFVMNPGLLLVLCATPLTLVIDVVSSPVQWIGGWWPLFGEKYEPTPKMHGREPDPF
jgi:hypothetical protein